MDGGVTLSTIVGNVSTLTTAMTSMFSSLDSYWFMFLPLTFTLFGFILGKVKSILFFKRRRRG